MGIYYLPGPIIPAGEAYSNAVDCGGNRILRIVMPDDGWDGGAPLTFQLSPDNVAFNDLHRIQDTSGSFQPYEVIVPTVIPNAILVMPQTTGEHIFWIRFRSGTKGNPIPQQASRKFRVVMWVDDVVAE
jgi:hypothetical protein